MRRTIRASSRKVISCAGVVALTLALTVCHQPSANSSDVAPIVGTWVVTIPGAPFPAHMFLFHADGTVVQSNPDAGDANTSDSNLMGAWVREADGFRAKLVEFKADRETHKLTGHLEIALTLKVNGDTFSATGSAVNYDPADHAIGTPIQFTMSGKRVRP